MKDQAPSAGDHQWRAITVHIHPAASSTSLTVVLRRMKGADCIWQRRVLSEPIRGLVLDDAPSVREALSLAADAMWEALIRTQDTPDPS
jgi:hypothetical protein